MAIFFEMKHTFVTKLPGGLTISKNPLNWIVNYGSQSDQWYFQTLEGAADALFELRLKNEALKAAITKDHIQKLIDCVEKTRNEVLEDVKKIVLVTNAGDLTAERAKNIAN